MSTNDKTGNRRDPVASNSGASAPSGNKGRNNSRRRNSKPQSEVQQLLNKVKQFAEGGSKPPQKPKSPRRNQGLQLLQDLLELVQQRPGSQQKRQALCYNCQQPGHIAKYCQNQTVKRKRNDQPGNQDVSFEKSKQPKSILKDGSQRGRNRSVDESKTSSNSSASARRRQRKKSKSAASSPEKAKSDEETSKQKSWFAPQTPIQPQPMGMGRRSSRRRNSKLRPTAPKDHVTFLQESDQQPRSRSQSKKGRRRASKKIQDQTDATSGQPKVAVLPRSASQDIKDLQVLPPKSPHDIGENIKKFLSQETDVNQVLNQSLGDEIFPRSNISLYQAAMMERPAPEMKDPLEAPDEEIVDTELGPLVVKRNLPKISLRTELGNIVGQHGDKNLATMFNENSLQANSLSIAFDVDKRYRGVTTQAPPSFYPKVQLAIRKQLDEYLKAEYVEEYAGDKWYGRVPLQAVSKEGEKVRLVMDARELNLKFSPPEIQLPTIADPLLVGVQDDEDKYYTKIDLTEAFMHVTLSQEFRPWFTFDFLDENGNLKHYRWCKMGFGWNMAPYIFQTLLKSFFAYLSTCILDKGEGYRERTTAFVYYDDILLVDGDPDRLKRNTEKAVSALLSYGFRINEKKSSLEPRKKIHWIGFDLSPKGASLPSAFKTSLINEYGILERKRTWGLLLAYLGKLQWAATINRQCLPRLSLLHAVVPPEIRCDTRRHQETCHPLLSNNQDFLQDLQGVVMDLTDGEPYYPWVHAHTFEIYTDAAADYYGFFGSEEAQFAIQEVDKLTPISYRELGAIYILLTKAPEKCNLRILTDSYNSLHAIKRGSSTSEKMRNLLTHIFDIIEKKDLTVVCRYVNTKLNKADRPSREKLPAITQQKVWDRFFRPETGNNRMDRKEYREWLASSWPSPPEEIYKVLLGFLSSPKTSDLTLNLYHEHILARDQFFQGYSAKILTNAIYRHRCRLPFSKNPASFKRSIERMADRLGAYPQPGSYSEEELEELLKKKKNMSEVELYLRKRLVPSDVPVLQNLPVVQGFGPENEFPHHPYGKGINLSSANMNQVLPQAYAPQKSHEEDLLHHEIFEGLQVNEEPPTQVSEMPLSQTSRRRKRSMPETEIQNQRRRDDSDPDYEEGKDSLPDSLQWLSRQRGALGLASKLDKASHQEGSKQGQDSSAQEAQAQERFMIQTAEAAHDLRQRSFLKPLKFRERSSLITPDRDQEDVHMESAQEVFLSKNPFQSQRVRVMFESQILPSQRRDPPPDPSPPRVRQTDSVEARSLEEQIQSSVLYQRAVQDCQDLARACAQKDQEILLQIRQRDEARMGYDQLQLSYREQQQRLNDISQSTATLEVTHHKHVEQSRRDQEQFSALTSSLKFELEKGEEVIRKLRQELQNSEADKTRIACKLKISSQSEITLKAQIDQLKKLSEDDKSWQKTFEDRETEMRKTYEERLFQLSSQRDKAVEKHQLILQDFELKSKEASALQQEKQKTLTEKEQVKLDHGLLLSKNESLAQEVHSFKLEKLRWEGQVSQSKSANESLLKESQELVLRNQELLERLHLKDATIRMQEQKINELSLTQSTKSQEIEFSEQRRSDILLELEKFKIKADSDKKSLKDEIAALKNSSAKAEKQFQVDRQLLSNLRQESLSSAKTISDLQSQIQRSHNDLLEARRQTEKLKAAEVLIAKAPPSKGVDLHPILNVFAKSLNIIWEDKVEPGDIANQIKLALEKQVDSHQLLVEELRKSIEKVSAERTDLILQLETQKNKTLEFSESVRIAKQSAEKAVEDTERVRSQLSTLKKKFVKLETELKVSNDERDSFEEELMKAHKETTLQLEKLESAKRTQEREEETYQESISDLTEELKKAKSQHQALKKVIEEQNQSCEVTQTMQRDSLSENIRLKGKVDALEQSQLAKSGLYAELVKAHDSLKVERSLILTQRDTEAQKSLLLQRAVEDLVMTQRADRFTMLQQYLKDLKRSSQQQETEDQLKGFQEFSSHISSMASSFQAQTVIQDWKIKHLELNFASCAKQVALLHNLCSVLIEAGVRAGSKEISSIDINPNTVRVMLACKFPLERFRIYAEYLNDTSGFQPQDYYCPLPVPQLQGLQRLSASGQLIAPDTSTNEVADMLPTYRMPEPHLNIRGPRGPEQTGKFIPLGAIQI